jgi:hypothetical protein
MVVMSDKIIGYRVSISKSEKNHIADMDSESSSEEEDGSFAGESQLDGGVLELYDNPNIIDVFISNLKEVKEEDSYKPF